MTQTIKERVKAEEKQLLETLATLVSYPSVNHNNEEGTPFGVANRDCLHKALEIGASLGFKTGNVEDKCGYIEMGEGEEIIGICGHLDVVPVSETWNTNPFEMTLIDGKYYGRGTSDDKGGVVCALTAMKVIQDMGIKLNKRVRLIMGCNEESGSRGLARYVQVEGPVSCGFTPDGAFPIIFGEKGMCHGLFHSKSEKVVDIKGGIAPNAVCASVTFTLVADSYCPKKLEKFFTENNITYTLENNGAQDTLVVRGQAAHASTPQEGVNAISYGIEGLYQAGINDEFITKYHDLIGTGYNGAGMGIDLTDEYGCLTFNVGMAFKKDDELCCTIDIRFPVTMKANVVIPAFEAGSKGTVSNIDGADPLFFPLQHPMIKAMLDAYYEVTGNVDQKPMTMGGGTYARTMPNIVAFGCDDGKYNYHIHDDNEFVTLDSLLMQAECYAKAIINLNNI